MGSLHDEGQMDEHVGFGDQRVEGCPIRKSPGWYVVFVQPCDAGSNGRRAIPTTRPTAGPPPARSPPRSRTRQVVR